MIKIGRNDPCLCGSGKKFKKCCYLKMKEKGGQLQPAAAPKISVQEEVERIREVAARKEAKILHLGVFMLFSTNTGDAWLLELTDLDGVQVAAGGERIELEIEENADTIEINWTHRFVVRNRKFVTTAYKDKAVTTHEQYPVHSIQAAIRKIRKKFSPELLSSIHLNAGRPAET
jgi:hypothetical protein